MLTDEVPTGGLRKEWFLLLCRSLFSPSYGMFITPEDSGSALSWFNPGSVGMVDEEDYWLLGAVVGLGCYHADTLDIPLPLVSLSFPLLYNGLNELTD
jgi:E3 ubiquitin-protein ligase HECTD2